MVIASSTQSTPAQWRFSNRPNQPATRPNTSTTNLHLYTRFYLLSCSFFVASVSPRVLGS